jgi:hypothetical protein
VLTHIRRFEKALLTLALTVALTAASLLGTTAPANAACLSAEAQWSLYGNSAYLVGPKRCVVDTPWNEGARRWDYYYAGPVGVGWQVWVPLPPF